MKMVSMINIRVATSSLLSYLLLDSARSQFDPSTPYTVFCNFTHFHRPQLIQFSRHVHKWLPAQMSAFPLSNKAIKQED